MSPTTAPLTAVSISGEVTTVTGDAFTRPIAVKPGVNVVGVRAEADDGGRSVDARAFFHGDVHPPDETLQGAALVHLSPAFLDDGEPDLDDLAGVFELLLVDPAFLAILKETPIDNDFVVLTPTEVTVQSASVDVEPLDGELRLAIALNGVHLGFTIDDKFVDKDILTGPGTLDLDQATITVYLALSAQGGAVTTEATSVELVTAGFAVTVDALPDFQSEYPSLAKFAQEYVEKSLTETTAELMGTFLGKLLEGFAFHFTYGETTPLDISLELNTASVAPHGMNLSLDARVKATLADGVPFGPLVGSLATQSTPPDAAFSTAPMAIAIDDDLVNQLLFALWYGGAFTNVALAGAELAELDLGDLPQVFQPLSKITMSMDLPMTVGPRLLAQDDYLIDLALGELRLRLETSTGKAFDLNINARDGAKVAVDDKGLLTAIPDSRPKTMELQVACTSAPPTIDPGSVAALIRLGFPPLLDKAAAGFAFPVPPLELGKLWDSPVLAGKALLMQGLTIGTGGAEKHFLVLEGSPLVK